MPYNVLYPILVMLNCSLVFGYSPSAYSAEESVAAEENPCERQIAAPGASKGDHSAAYERMEKGLSVMSECGLRIVIRAQRMLRGDDSVDWDGYNQDLQALIDKYQEALKSFTGSGGVIESLKRVLARMKREVDDALTRGRNPNEDEALQNLVDETKRLDAGIQTAERNLSGINQEVVELIALRPEIARRIRLMERDELISDLEGLNDRLSAIRKAFVEQRKDPSLVPETGN